MSHIPCLYVVIDFKLCANKERNVTNLEVLLSSPVARAFQRKRYC